MMEALARVMVDAAARRWPAASEVRREWLAELDFLAAQGNPGRMMWFAAGLAFARPGHAPVVGFNWRTAGTAFSLLAGPLMLVAIAFGVAAAAQSQLSYSGSDWQAVVVLLAILVLCLGLAFLFGRWWGRRSVVTGPVPLAVVLTISITVTMALPWILRGEPEYYLFHELLTGISVWPFGLFGILFLLARAVQVGRGRWAVVLAFVTWLVVLDVAVIVGFLPNVGEGQDPVPGVTGIPLGKWEAAHAPMWFVGGLTGQSFGVLNAYEREDVIDDLVFMPHLLIVFGIYAMSYVARAARPRSTANNNS